MKAVSLHERFSTIQRLTLLQLLFLVLVLASVIFPVAAQPSDGDTDADPLRSADTSSPRDTLHSFLANVKAVIEARRRGEMTTDVLAAFRRAAETLDFRTTPDGDTWSGRTKRILLLQEVLARVDLPPDEEIPSDREVAGGDLKEWVIPGTPITLALIESGPREGEYLFSGRTVGGIDALYRQAKALPYRPDALHGIYEAYLRSEESLAAIEGPFRIRLKPVDTTSPRSTLNGFLDSVNRAYALIEEATAALSADPPTMTIQEAREIEAEAVNLLQRASAALDLSKVPKAQRDDVALESILQLKEILDRSLLPPLDAVPDQQTVAAARHGGSPLFLAGADGLRWKMPNTEIEIVEITKGPHQGEFLFSSDTVGKLEDYYESVQDLPYRPESIVDSELSYTSPGLSPGLYDFYISTPGVLIPQLDFLGRIVDALPDSLKSLYAGQTLWQWIALFVSVLLSLLTAWLVFRVIRRLAARSKTPARSWLLVLVPVLIAVLVDRVTRFVDYEINITGRLLATVHSVGSVLSIGFAAWAAFAVFRALAETIVASPRIDDPGPEASLVRIGTNILGFLAALWIVVAGLQSLGADLIPILAGLGVGGLAVALAAQRTLANLLGSLLLYINKPVKVGDFCRYDGQIGTVEEIGWLSTRIRSLERTLVTVPNSDFSEMKLENFAVRDERLFKVVLQLRYETTPDQMRLIIVKLRELLIGHPMVTESPARVRFVGLGAFSKDVEIFSYLRCKDQGVFLAVQEDLLLRMEGIIDAAGSGFAFPSQTAYLTRDSGLDIERQGKAESEIRDLRSNGKLPFPELEDEERERLEDRLDYPPKGSPAYVAPAKRPAPPPPTERLPDEIPEDEHDDAEGRGTD